MNGILNGCRVARAKMTRRSSQHRESILGPFGFFIKPVIDLGNVIRPGHAEIEEGAPAAQLNAVKPAQPLADVPVGAKPGVAAFLQVVPSVIAGIEPAVGTQGAHGTEDSSAAPKLEVHAACRQD